MAFFETSDGVKLFFQQKGEGNSIVFVHGWSGDHTIFEPSVNELSKRYKIVSYDLRGHGSSDRPEHGLTLKRFATDLEELMASLELNDVTLVGHSMGASTTFEYVKNYGVSRLKSVSIFDMTPKLLNDDEWKLGLYHGKYTKEDVNRDLTQMNEDYIKFAGPFAKSVLPYLTDEMLEQHLEMVKGNTPHVLAAMWHAMAVSDFRDVLPKITVPTQIIYGEKSTLYSKETAEYLHSQIPHSKVIPFEHCTHMLVAENPVKTTQVIEEMAGMWGKIAKQAGILMLRTDLQEGLAIEFETLKNNLSSEHYELFKRVHAKQLTTFWEGMEAKENRNLDHITTVMWDQEEDCLKVSFDDGETWRFTKNEEWF